jgi:hypothetical protein
MAAMLIVPRSALPPHPDRLFQPKPGILYLDESGQMNANRNDPEAIEPQVIGGVMIPDSENDRTILRVLVSDLRRRIHGSELSPKTIKAKHLTAEHRRFVADSFSPDWIVSTRVAAVNAKAVSDARDALLEYGDGAISSVKTAVAELGVDVGPLEEQFRTEVRRNPIYVWLLANVYWHVAKWFRPKAIRPRLTVYLDEKIPREYHALLQFIGRAFIYDEFPEVYRGRKLLELFGDSKDFNCAVGSDDEIDGLILADIIANAAGRVARGDDPDGSFGRLVTPVTS